MPYGQETYEQSFPSPFVFIPREPVTLVELRMRRFAGLIRAKPEWWKKVQDAALVVKWRAEMKQWPRDPITDAQLDYIFDQLKYEARLDTTAQGIFATMVPYVYESRSLIPAEAKSALLSLVSVLEDVPKSKQDWHPGSDKQVLDLVHPSLYPLRIGHSYVREKSASTGEILGVHHYQWLPTDFELSETGVATALGYINNLHPGQHRAGYAALSSILSRFVPLFEAVLSDVLAPPTPLVVSVDPLAWYDHLDEEDEDGEESADDDEDDDHDLNKKYWPLIPDPPRFSPPSSDDRVHFKLCGRTVQVIVKLANIVLTPKKPKYSGGSWHVEGMANEKIVATGIYYYACDNITQSQLGFRTVVGNGHEPEDRDQLPYEQDDATGYYTAYGFGGGDPLNQRLGHIVAEEGKCIAFPNLYQHRVDPFELADRKKPGHRKILCFFLVDPLTRIHSTSDIPPQQEEWLTDEMLRAPGLQILSGELFKMIVDHATEATISRKEAEEHRERIMDERQMFVMSHNENVYEVEFNMCEH
ncbi:uncharacterized protein TRAVEDRAFT_134541 [Trametes versicolor FP-101664 SS1]|uniref:uncharacterized protein n=1 Tax=Trametes versicolor (strain FP-101664) TaxID=717944 RepID=UPI00046216AF|nr:uncharacterized protein TRAVEDRAFT_134541 [Trametes versicolor FP-101664 SS1]EIW52510.1 hypothetical protein TRAVEDRAFT_134541 [Trametes versicolor FP-101664 SS1]